MPELPLLLLPGLDGTGELFHKFVALAPTGIRPVVVRLPPLGLYRELLQWVTTQLPEGRFAILGESFSGPLAMAVAREHPERVKAVVLVNSFLAPPITPLLRFLPWSLLFAVPPPRWVVRHFFVGETASPELVEEVRAAVAKTPRSVLAARMRSVFTLQPAPPLNVPVLTLSSANDRMVRPKRGKNIPGPHLLLQACPREAWAEIAPFLGR